MMTPIADNGLELEAESVQFVLFDLVPVPNAGLDFVIVLRRPLLVYIVCESFGEGECLSQLRGLKM